MDESRFASSTGRIRRTGLIFKLMVARVRFHSELRHQTDERLDLGQCRTFGVFDFAEVSSRSCVARHVSVVESLRDSNSPVME